MKIAGCQLPYVHQNLEQAVAHVLRMAVQAQSEGAQLVCFPECYLQGYVYDGEETEALALELHSAAFLEILKQLRSIEATLVVGLIELEAGTLYNTAVVIRKGEVVGRYRKATLLPGERMFEPGDAFPVFEVEGLKFGITICNDLNVSECAQAVALQGAEVLICPCNNMMRRAAAEVWKEKHNEIRAHRARETGLFLISSDVTGEWNGRVSYGPTAVIGPDGTVLQQVPLLEEGMVLFETRRMASSPFGNGVKHGTE